MPTSLISYITLLTTCQLLVPIAPQPFTQMTWNLAGKHNRQHWQVPDVPADLVKRVIYVCIHKIYFSEILWGKNFLGHFWLGIFIQDNVPVNLKQEVWLISQLLSGMEQKTTSSLDRSSTSSNTQAAAFAVPLCKDKKFMAT